MLSAVRSAAEDNGPLTTDYGQLEQDKKIARLMKSELSLIYNK